MDETFPTINFMYGTGLKRERERNNFCVSYKRVLYILISVIVLNNSINVFTLL